MEQPACQDRVGFPVKQPAQECHQEGRWEDTENCANQLRSMRQESVLHTVRENVAFPTRLRMAKNRRRTMQGSEQNIHG
jgi:hypothetical protein